jgi:histidinol dehydrogenase
MFRIIKSADKKSLERLFRARQTRLEEAEATARRILEDVRREGDGALIRYAKRFDGVDLRREGFSVARDEIRRAHREVRAPVIEALRVASASIRVAARRQLPRPWLVANGRGVRLKQVVRSLDRVACYVPGGRFPLPSTVLMSVIPAQVAGVREIVITSPRPAPVVLLAADILGIKKIFRLGGAQAIAAFAYGTESVPRADKIVGPGNCYVAAAKKLVAGECGIDFVAGPTELVMVGSRGRPQWIAADLVAQAEHDPDALALLITPSHRLAIEVQAEIASLLRHFLLSAPPGLPVAERALTSQGAVILTRDLEEAVALVNRLAPEHLALLDGATRLLGRIQSAGSIFLGDYSAVAAGDYASGSNHILPTGGATRLRGGLSAADFVKTISAQHLSRQGLSRLRSAIVTLARAEGLKAHAHSIETRFKSDAQTP